MTEQSTQSYIHQDTPFPMEQLEQTNEFPFFGMNTQVKSTTGLGLSRDRSFDGRPLSLPSPPRRVSQMQFPRPHATSSVSAHFKLASVTSPVPPSLLQRKASSSSTLSRASSISSTSSWGNWDTNSPVTNLSRCVSMTSDSAGEGMISPVLQTPETKTFESFESEPLVEQSSMAIDLGSAVFSDSLPHFSTWLPPFPPSQPKRKALRFDSETVPDVTRSEMKASMMGESKAAPVLSSSNHQGKASKPFPTPSMTSSAPTPTRRPKLTRRPTPNLFDERSNDIMGQVNVRSAAKSDLHHPVDLNLSIAPAPCASLLDVALEEEEPTEDIYQEDFKALPPSRLPSPPRI